MAYTLAEKDMLAHVNTEQTLHQQATLTGGCITIFEKLGVKLELCWNIQGNEVCVKVDLNAFGQSVSLGNACLGVGKSTTLSGHIDDLAKAEVQIEIESGPKICFSATGCVKPFIGSWHCASTGRHCISI